MIDLKRIRCDLHQIPEIGMHEFKTKEYLLNILKNFKCRIFEIGETGLIAFFDFNKEDSICFRADMDALPVNEQNDVWYKSKNLGYMHACGHDGHMSMLLGLCEYLDSLNEYKYNVSCLFQPSEEIYGGARSVVDSKILDKLNTKAMFGMHIWPNLAKGKIYSMPKGMLAKSAEVDIEIIGKTVHAANRDEGIDSILIASKYLINLYDLASKIKEPHLLNFGKIEGGTIRNSVAEKTKLFATMRAFDDQTFAILQNNLFNASKNYNAEFNIEIRSDFPFVYNDPELIKKMDFINILEKPFMQAEDFGLYTSIYPCLFLLLGAGNTSMLHQSTFDFDMNILNDGLAAYKKILKIMAKDQKIE